MRIKKRFVLKLDPYGEEDKEIDFELDYLCSLTRQQRFQAMFKKTQEMRHLLGRRGYRKTAQVIKRSKG